jgi:hypothetical protein
VSRRRRLARLLKSETKELRHVSLKKNRNERFFTLKKHISPEYEFYLKNISRDFGSGTAAALVKATL